MLQSLLPRKPVMRNDLIGGADYTLTKLSLPQQSSFLSTSAFPGRESMTGRDEVKSEPFTVGSADLGNLMADPYTEEDARIMSTACYFASDDVEGPEEGMPLFGSASDAIRTDYNWDQCFGNLEDVDNLLSSGPDLTFGPAPAGHAVESMQWHNSASPPAVHLENVSIAKSPLRVAQGAATVEGNLGAITNLRMEFVPSDAPLVRPTLEKAELGLKTVDYMPVGDERWSNSQSGTQFLANDHLEDGEAMAGDDVPLPKMNGVTCVAMDMSEDGGGGSSVSHSDSEKASMAQVQRARRHAANRKRFEERSRRGLSHRKFAHGSVYSNSHAPSSHMLQPIPLQLAPHGNHFSQPPTAAALYGFVAPRSNLSPMQPVMRPAAPFSHVGYSPSIRHIQPVPPTLVSSHTGLFMGYQQPGSFQPTAMVSPHQQFQLRTPLPMDPPPPSSSSMTPQEKIEKLKYLQQMQARLAVEHQQQQFVAQGATPMESSLSPSLAAHLPQIIPAVRQPDVPVSSLSELKMSAVESEFEPSLSVGQTSLDTTSEGEAASMEAAVLDTLQNSVKSLEAEAKLCIRDALYRLARSAMRRNGSGGRGGGEESGNNTQATEDGDAASDGLESSINSDPCSSSRVSRMNINMVETQTNPIDRYLAHLLFHKSSQQPQAPAQSAPSDIVLAQVLGIPDAQPDPLTWHKGDLSPNSWQQSGGPSLALPVAEMGASPIRPPVALIIPATHTGAPQFQGPASPGMINIADHGVQQIPNGLHVPNGDSPSPPPAKLSLDCRSGIRKKKLEHALGLKELSQLLAEGLDVGSATLCKEEVTAGSPLSNASTPDGQQQQTRSYPAQRRMLRQGEPMRSC